MTSTTDLPTITPATTDTDPHVLPECGRHRKGRPGLVEFAVIAGLNPGLPARRRRTRRTGASA